MNGKAINPKKVQCKKWTLSFKEKDEFDKLRNNQRLSFILSFKLSLIYDLFYSIWKVTFTKKLYETEVRSRVRHVICVLNPTVTFTHKKKPPERIIETKDETTQTDNDFKKKEVVKPLRIKTSKEGYKSSRPRKNKEKRIPVDIRTAIDSWFMLTKDTQVTIMERYPELNLELS